MFILTCKHLYELNMRPGNCSQILLFKAINFCIHPFISLSHKKLPKLTLMTMMK